MNLPGLGEDSQLCLGFLHPLAMLQLLEPGILPRLSVAFRIEFEILLVVRHFQHKRAFAFRIVLTRLLELNRLWLLVLLPQSKQVLRGPDGAAGRRRFLLRHVSDLASAGLELDIRQLDGFVIFVLLLLLLTNLFKFPLQPPIERF